MDDDEVPEETAEHRADVEVVMLLVSPVHRYGGRPRDGAAPPPPAPESVSQALVVAGRGLAGDRYSVRPEHADAAVTLDCGDGPVSLRGGRPAAPCSWMDTVLAPGAHAALRGRAGVRCAAVGGGTLSVGPAVLTAAVALDAARAGHRPVRR